jgi:hypothetical protein
MRELASHHRALHLSALQGDSEARSASYLKYGARVLQLTTKQCLENSVGLETRFLNRNERCMAL